MADPIECFVVEDRDGVWVRVDNDEVLNIEHPKSYWAFPLGAIWWWSHEEGHAQMFGPDPRPMPHLAVQTPAGRFCIDCCSTDKVYWARTGEPPNVTVTPSINIGPEVWHGRLTDGRLVA